MFVYFRAPIGGFELAKRTLADTFEDGCPGLAAQLAFYFLLAVFPALLFVVALLSYLPIQPALDPTLKQLDTFLPGEILSLIREHMDQVMTGASGGLLTFGIAGAIWSSSSAMTAIITALNRAYDIEEWRPWWKTRLTAVALTVALAVFSVTAFALVVGGTDLAGWLAARAGLGKVFETAWGVLQWPVTFVLVVFAVDLVYYFAPNADTAWVWITPGSLLATTLWLVISFGFRLYVQNFANYAVVYGAIGGVIVLMLWLYLSGFALLVGAELNAEIDKALPDRDLTPHGPEHKRKIGPAAERSLGAAPSSTT
jgi:membrane protein